MEGMSTSTESRKILLRGSHPASIKTGNLKNCQSLSIGGMTSTTGEVPLLSDAALSISDGRLKKVGVSPVKR